MKKPAGILEKKALAAENKIIAVTGSSGFVGSHLIAKLRQLDFRVIEIDIVNGFDITDWNQIQAVREFDVLVHLAAKTYVPESYKDPREFYRVNINTTLNCLELCKRYNAKLIFASSYVYGVPQYLPIDEKHPVTPFNPYAASKILCEELCENYHRHFSLPVIICRPFNIYGKGQSDHFLIPTILRQAQLGEIHLKDPKPRRDFIFIDDLIDAYIKAVAYNKTAFEIFNIGSGKSHAVSEVTELIAKNIDGEIKINYSREERKNEVMDTVADISRAEQLLGWRPMTDLETGIKRIVK